MSAELVFCRVCGQAWQGAKLGDRCPQQDGGILIDLEAHQRYPHDVLLGRMLKERFAVVGVLGEGGMGAVYKAIQQPVGRPVALKVINSDMDDPHISARFFQEARVVSRLSDPSIVTLYDYGEAEDGSLYMVFEFIHGKLMFDMLREGRFEPKRAVDLMLQVLGGLVEAHAMGLVHRDLKPENIMVTANNLGEEKAKVLDFGIAKVVTSDDTGVRTREGIVLGTPRYMSPEQAQDLPLDGRSDLYSLGVILYELLTGNAPFTRGAAIEILMAHINNPPPPIDPALGVPPGLVAVVMKALQKRPADRFADAESMAKALRASLSAPAHKPVAPPPAEDGLGETLMLDDAETQNKLKNLPRPPRPSIEAPRNPPPRNPAPRTVVTEIAEAPRGFPRWALIALIVLALAGLGVGIAFLVSGGGGDEAVEEGDGPVRIKIGE
ncbi:MAG: serine/threonine-protein kinase [bacterium]